MIPLEKLLPHKLMMMKNIILKITSQSVHQIVQNLMKTIVKETIQNQNTIQKMKEMLKMKMIEVKMVKIEQMVMIQMQMEIKEVQMEVMTIL